ncbi:tetratricopeptide repeat protein [Actinacidiphila glaucinigra]|uniref:tetratricopeptide repeat protein n=1 Tax=Actinacidiphila glaucinigra TaxID=235986 RepID=UPI0038094FE5
MRTAHGSWAPLHPDTLGCRSNLALALVRMGEYAQAVQLDRQTLEDRTRVLGPDHPDTLSSRNNLALALGRMREYTQAVQLHRRTLEDRTRILGPDHPDTLRSRNHLERALVASRRPARRRGRWLSRRIAPR